jgi:multiple sugar transport system ATP-binding protein
MTVYDNMAFSLRMRGFTKNEIEQRVRESAEILGLDEILKRKPRELSGGQRQRVALGRAIARKLVVLECLVVRVMSKPISDLKSFHLGGTVAVNLPFPHGLSMAPRE